MRHLKTFEMYDFNFNDDVFYLYIENGVDKSVIKLTRNYEWDIELIDGVYPDRLESSFRSQYDIDQIIDLLKPQYDEVSQISEDEIDDYMIVEGDDNKKEVINSVITKLKEFNNFPVDKEVLKSLINMLNKVNIKPVDIIAAYKTDNDRLQKQYLITGPSAPGGGGNGALRDLSEMLKKL